MPRGPRIHYPGAIYHVMARGVDGREIFIDDHDRRSFIDTARAIKSEVKHSVLAYCLMGNHFHFAIRVLDYPLSRIIHRLLTTYVLRFNTRHSRQGHLFQARYKSVLCLNDSYLIALIRYIHMNPVRAGLVSNPGDWRWSSHREYAGQIGFALADRELFFDAQGARNLNFLDYERWPIPQEFDAWPTSLAPTMLLRKEQHDLESIEAIAASFFPDEIALLKAGSRQRVIVRKKEVLVDQAIRAGHSLVSVAKWLNCTPTSAFRLLKRNKVNKVKPDPIF